MKTFLASLWLLVSVQAMAWSAHQGPIRRMAFSPDKEFFLSAGGDGLVKVWWSSCSCYLTTFKHDQAMQVFDATFFNDIRAISAAHDGTVYIWNKETGEKIQAIKGHSTYVAKVVVSEDGKHFFTAGTDDNVVMWNADDYREEMRVRTKSPIGLVALADNQTFVTAGLEGIKVWEKGNEKAVRTLSTENGFLAMTGYDPTTVLAGGKAEPGTGLRLIEVATGKVMQSFPALSGSIIQVARSLDGKYVGALTLKGAISIYEKATGKLVYHSAGKINEPLSFTFVPDAKAILAGTNAGTIELGRF